MIIRDQDPSKNQAALRAVLGDIPTRAHGTPHPVMDIDEVLRVLQLSEIAGIPVVVDGGWGVDALLGWQTREHADLDLALNHQHLPRLLKLLSRLGYQHLPRNDEWEHNFVLEDELGHQVDLHTFIQDETGQVVGGVKYPRESLQGRGKIMHLKVTCVPPEWSLQFHTGYPLDETDYRDMRYLCNLYSLKLPEAYARFESKGA
ncbi:MAG: hypothetical protein VB029_09395 [Anaerolineaceae bacterium]|nr:hypothetical protein [Anaerolineaceae bacterium]HNX45195.1 hypothetical protein [Anaerolineaceae bacterium]HPT24571.1 hypothetical protein [Anaerolineaceae bacterium]